MFRTRVLTILAVSATLAQAQAVTPLDARESSCGASASPLLILGTYHMDNPGFDAVNLAADDPRSPRRQRELVELLDKLQAFRPTVVAVEAVYGRSPWLTRYRDYLKGAHVLGANEIEQIGFQLARRMGLPNIVGVDFPMWMDGRVPDEIDYDWKPAAATAAPSAAPRSPSEAEQLLSRSTVTEYLRQLNSEASIRNDAAGYLGFLKPSTTSNAPFENTDALVNWYKRNFRIFANLYRVATPGRDRVVLLIGSGHLALLRQMAIDVPEFCLVDTDAILRR